MVTCWELRTLWQPTERLGGGGGAVDRGSGRHKMEKTLKYKADFVPSTQEQMSFLNLGLFKLKPDTSWSSSDSD